MNIKSLLLGSAAALAVVSGAQAADAIVAAEPEPMEYVRVCDAFGTGYFYIPGTETCLKISGRVRYTTSWQENELSSEGFLVDRTHQSVDGRVAFDAKNDSEYGTISSMLRLGAKSEDNGSAVLNGVAFSIKIGGLEFAGKDNTMWADGHGGLTDNDGFFNSAGDPIHVGYTADFDAGSVFVVLDHNPTGNPEAEKFIPNVAVGGKAKFGDFTASASVGYDEFTDSVAVAGTIKGDVGIVGFVLTGLYSNDANNFYYGYDGFSVLGSVSVKATDTVSVAGLAQWWDDDTYLLVGNVSWAVASGFEVMAEAQYDRDENAGAFLRVTRKF